MHWVSVQLQHQRLHAFYKSLAINCLNAMLGAGFNMNLQSAHTPANACSALVLQSQQSLGKV
jgi:hypothetical protein